MPDIQLPDLIKSASDAAQDNFPATMEQTDGALSAIVGFFNNVVLYPVKKANISFRYKLEAFRDDMAKKIKNIPPEHLQEPPVMIAGPALEALRYAYDEDELREMYENLLASAMDNRISSKAHPSFVDAIRQMTPLEAKIIEILATLSQLKCAEIQFDIKDTNQHYSKAMPNYFVEELYLLGDPFLVSSSLINIQRLGLIEITLMGITGETYESFKTHPFVLERETLFKTFGRDFTIEISKHALKLNNYGSQFAKICLGKEV